MQLNHIHLMVTDVAKAADFFTQHFGLSIIHASPKLTSLRDAKGLILTLMYTADAAYPKYFHIGFFVADRIEVLRIYGTLKQSGIDTNPPADTNHGYSFYVSVPGGCLLEVGSQ